LKEVSEEKGENWDLRELALTNSPAQTWNNVARWTFGILHLPEKIPWKLLPDRCDLSFRSEWLRNIVAVNINKTGGGSSSNPANLTEFLRSNRNELRQQLQLYVPNFTICCGTGEYLTDLLEPSELGKWDMTSNGLWYSKCGMLGIAIKYYHPQVRYPNNFLYTMLIDGVKELLIGNGC